MRKYWSAYKIHLAMTYSDVLDYFKSQEKAAAAIGIKQSSVAGWKRSNKVPLRRQIQYEIETGGALRADLPEQVRSQA